MMQATRRRMLRSRDRDGGPVETCQARSTGTFVSVYDNRLMQFEDVGGLDAAETRRLHRDARWATVCETHGTYCLHGSLALARRFRAAPEEWCDDCREVRECPCCGSKVAPEKTTREAPAGRVEYLTCPRCRFSTWDPAEWGDPEEVGV